MNHRAGVAKPILSRKMTVFIAAVVMAIAFGGAAIFNYSPSVADKAETLPICADTQGRIEASLVKVTEVPMHPKCKSGSIHLPYGFRGYLETGINKELEVWFLDGRHVLAPRGKPVPFGDHPNNRDFQIRGDEGILRIQPDPMNSGISSPSTGSTSA